MHKEKLFWFPRLSGVTIATSLSESTREFLKLPLHMLPYNETLKVFKSKIWLDIWKQAPQYTSKYRISAKSVKGFESYEHLKFRPMHQLKYKLWRHNYVIVVTSQTFCDHCVEYIKLDTCAKFHDHQSNNNKVPLSPNWWLKKSPCQIGLKMPKPPFFKDK